ncbi:MULTISPECIES: amidohydrolase family protein [unclassified Nocardioides]|uniref:amidohydrolase family protein n=1 Tax=unclassified Nocardioides TaxID=2615069 RepID=UPI0009F00372|nr:MULTISPECIES: amidohydrolase family protein [unclassified Nocardioides]GAW47890.1 Amidohydrolase family protein [Nocardioides sp. PD653-B2]GAW53807.1 Amidohydrolase family protein [Nocardioides sp. PD653]
MKDGKIVFDAVVHVHDYRDEMLINDDGYFLKKTTRADIEGTRRNGQEISVEATERPPDIAWSNKVLFEDSDTDFAMVQTIPLFGVFRDGMAPAAGSHRLAASNPERFVFCGGVDPIHQGVRGALYEMERQVAEWGATSFKFYQAQSMRHWWTADDRELAYPLFEKAQELGVKMVQFHKGLPLGRQRVETLRPNDIQLAAYDFPDLNFGLHHLGDPYVDETINIAARFPNIYLVLPVLFNQYFVQPTPMLHRLGQALLMVGEDRLCYGTDAFLWPKVQLYIDLLATLQFPEQLQDEFGYPEITEATREKIMGKNFAEGLGLDLPAMAARAGLTSNG